MSSFRIFHGGNQRFLPLTPTFLILSGIFELICGGGGAGRRSRTHRRPRRHRLCRGAGRDSGHRRAEAEAGHPPPGQDGGQTDGQDSGGGLRGRPPGLRRGQRAGGRSRQLGPARHQVLTYNRFSVTNIKGKKRSFGYNQGEPLFSTKDPAIGMR